MMKLRARLVRCCWVAVVLGVGGMLNATRVEALEVERAAQTPAPAPARASAPAELAKYLPAELAGGLLIRPAALAGGEFAKTVRAEGAELLYVELAREFHRYSGLPLEQTDCWLLCRSPGSKEELLCEVFASSAPINVEESLAWRAKLWERVERDGLAYYRESPLPPAIEDGEDEKDREVPPARVLQAVAFPSDRVMLAGPEEVVRQMLQAGQSNTGRPGIWQQRFASVAPATQIAVLATPGAASEFLPADALRTLTKDSQFVRAELTLDRPESAASLLDVRVTFANAEQAAAAHQAFSAQLAELKQQLQQDLGPYAAGISTEFARAAWEALDTLSSQTTGNEVQLALPRFAAFQPAAFQGVLAAIDKVRDETRSTQAVDRLHNVGIALHNFHDVHRGLPPGVEHDKEYRDANGRLYLSWRVHLLPVMGEKALFQQFHLDEPWDSEHNKRLIPLMPQIFTLHSDLGPGLTDVLAPSGEQTILGARISLTLANCLDGTSNTIFAFEGAPDHAVPWTKPDDFVFDPAEKHALARFGHPGHQSFLLLRADAGISRLSRATDPAIIGLLIDRMDGHPVDVRPFVVEEKQP